MIRCVIRDGIFLEDRAMFSAVSVENVPDGEKMSEFRLSGLLQALARANYRRNSKPCFKN